MSTFHSLTAEAFLDEMEMASLGASAATLGTLGGLAGLASGYSQARDEGAGVGGALAGGASKGLLWGAGGAGLGAGLGGISRALRGDAPVKFTRYAKGKMRDGTPWYKSMDRSIGDFGKRQLHSVTGYVPNGEKPAKYLHDIGVGGRDRAGALLMAKDKVKDLEKKPQGMIRDARLWLARRGQKGQEQAADATKTLLKHKATSLPGFVRAMADSTKRKDVLGASGAELWHGGGTVGKVMMGTQGAMMARGAIGEAPPGEEDQGRGERVGRAVGNIAGMALPSTIPMVGQMVGGSILGSGLGRVGRVFDGPKVVAPPSAYAPRPHRPRSIYGPPSRA
jgi:hypothetical protein